MVYNITTFIRNVFQYQKAEFNNAKLQLLLLQPNSFFFFFCKSNQLFQPNSFCVECLYFRI